MIPVRHGFSRFPSLFSAIHLLMHLPLVQSFYFKQPLYPCPTMEPITWIRDPADCHGYFICYFGQPINMPDCPASQVWSNRVKNCVPIRSHWDDCLPSPIPSDHRETTKVTFSNIDRSVSQHPTTVAISQWNTTTRRPNELSSSKVQKPSTPSTTTTTTTVTTTTPSTTTKTTKTTSTPTTPTTSPPPTTTITRFGPPCSGRQGILPHPTQCHWYYNCSLEADRSEWKKKEQFTVECPYPQLFDDNQMRCREYLNTNCGSRFEPVDRCEYREEQCKDAHCIPCEERFAKCRGKTNGIYPFRTDTWSPIFVSCYEQRNIAQDKCLEPTPIYSPVDLNCVSLYNVPKENGGLKPDCSFRKDGFYADEQGRCSVYFQCRHHNFIDYLECQPTFVFDPIIRKCTSPQNAPPPCGENQNFPSCQNREDGFYADEHGRCPYYFECKNFQFKNYHQCDFGSFDANQQQCIIPVDLTTKPCGLRANPCSNKTAGTHLANADSSSGRSCNTYIECSRGILIHKGICKDNKVFDSEVGRCQFAKDVLQPCGRRNPCAYKTDGQYPDRKKGCNYYYECRGGQFEGFETCKPEMGGKIFNSVAGKCDVHQNVCPPCGYKWFGCNSWDNPDFFPILPR